MRPRFCPYFLTFIFFSIGLLGVHSLAAEKSKSQAGAKTVKEKNTAKNDAKKQDKNARDNRKEKTGNKELAKAKQPEKKATDKKAKGKTTEKETAKKQEGKSRTKETAKITTAEKAKNAAKEVAKKGDKSNSENKKNTAATAKQSTAERNKTAQVTEKAEVKNTAKVTNKAKSETLPKATKDENTLLAKTVAAAATKSKSIVPTGSNSTAKLDEPLRQLPATKFTIRPVTKVTPKVELKFSLAKALAPSFDAPPPVEPAGPDVIEVIEHDSPENRKLDDLYRKEVKTLNLSAIPNVSSRKVDIKKMPSERISQIQEALQKRGYYSGAITGTYDDLTVESMRNFQMAHKIDVTGYATAHTLKLLGLTDWERSYE